MTIAATPASASRGMYLALLVRAMQAKKLRSSFAFELDASTHTVLERVGAPIVPVGDPISWLQSSTATSE